MSPMSRPLAGETLTFDLAAHVAELQQDEGYIRSGRSGRTLVKSGYLRVTLTMLARNTEVGTHHAETPMTLQVLQGRLSYRVGDDNFEMGRGEVLYFGPGHAQDIRALDDTALLLTITGGSADSE